MRRIACLAALLLACGDDTSSSSPDMNAAPAATTCTPTVAGADAKLPAGPQKDGSVILPGGRRITPAGTLLPTGGFPIGLRALPGGRYVVVTDDSYGTEALRIVDTMAADPKSAVVSHVDYPGGDSTAAPALFYGLAVTKDGKRIFASDGVYDPAPGPTPLAMHYNLVDAFDVTGDPPQLVRNDAASVKLYFNADQPMPVQRIPAGLALSSDEKTLYVATQYDGTLAIVDLRAGAGYGQEIGRATIKGIAPYDVAVDEASHTAFVSLWGGQRTGAGTGNDGVMAIDVSDPTKPSVLTATPIPTGKSAEAELIVGGQLFVANADADTLSLVDLATKQVRSVATTAATELGTSPTALAIDSAASRIWVVESGENAVAAIDMTSMKVVGRLPTAWYPTAVTVRDDGALVVACARGLGDGPTSTRFNPQLYQGGLVEVIPKPSDADLAAGMSAVAANLERPASYAAMPQCPSSGPKSFPVPPDSSTTTPIKHVFFIVRENKTYDADLGDLAGANGDPSLNLWDETVTPNAHAIARRFANLDNCYSPAEQSLQGHIWTTTATSNDYVEKAWQDTTGWGRGGRPILAFAPSYWERLTMPGSGSIFTHLDAANVSYHIYGELAATAGAKVQNDPGWPGYFQGLGVLDVDKVAYVDGIIQDPTQAVEQFSYIALPNDHTVGTTPGKPTPQSMIADNDEATGRFVDALSHSPYWPSSAVFIVEDDPSDGADHVEAHRSVCLVVSPWVKRGALSSVNYDVASIYRTMEAMLGVAPMNLHDGLAAPLYDIFSSTADAEPYTFIPRKVPMATNSVDSPMAQQSAGVDWSKPDQAPLGRILWKAARGKNAEPPWGPTDSPRLARTPLDDDGDDD